MSDRTRRHEIRDVRPDALMEIARLGAELRVLSDDAPRSVEQQAEHLRWLLYDTPADPAAPRGWIAADSGRVVGVILCFPQRFLIDDRPFTALMSGSFYVDPAHQAAGTALFFRFLREQTRWPLITTTANETSAELLRGIRAAPVPGTDHELLGVVRPGPVMEEWLRPRIGGRLARVAAPAGGLLVRLLRRGVRRGGRGSLRALDPLRLGPADLPPNRFPAGSVRAVRDVDYLRWRFGGTPGCSLFRWDDGDGSSALLAVRTRRRGARHQVRDLAVLDLWGDLDDQGVVAAVLAIVRHAGDQADTVTVRGLPDSAEAGLIEAGFLRRDYAGPVGWVTTRDRTLADGSWYLAPADGDAAV